MFNYDHLDAETISAVLENCRCLLCPCLGRPSLAIAIILLTDHFFTIEATKRNMLQDNCQAVNLVQSKANMH